MIRIGFGYDAHPLADGIPLVLGGVALDWPKGLAGHSDGDVLVHAVIDALLGAAALGDIGIHFPDTDPRYKGAYSLGLLSEVCGKLAAQGFTVHNVDCTLVAQRPRIQARIGEMRDLISKTLGVAIRQVSIKATTTEHMGFTGREEGMACYAVCTLLESKDMGSETIS